MQLELSYFVPEKIFGKKHEIKVYISICLYGVTEGM